MSKLAAARQATDAMKIGTIAVLLALVLALGAYFAGATQFAAACLVVAILAQGQSICTASRLLQPVPAAGYPSKRAR